MKMNVVGLARIEEIMEESPWRLRVRLSFLDSSMTFQAIAWGVNVAKLKKYRSGDTIEVTAARLVDEDDDSQILYLDAWKRGKK